MLVRSSTPATLNLGCIRRRLAERPGRRIPAPLAPERASVAIVLRERLDDAGALSLEALVIERARDPRDPWSGHVAFPGGRRAPGDANFVATAVREAREEIGLDLDLFGQPLGTLADLPTRAHGRRLPMAVTPVVFALPAGSDPTLAPDPREVASSLWVPLDALRSGRHDSRHTWKRVLGVWPIRMRCWRYDGKVIWGLTYRMLAAVLDLAGPAQRSA